MGDHAVFSRCRFDRSEDSGLTCRAWSGQCAVTLVAMGIELGRAEWWRYFLP